VKVWNQEDFYFVNLPSTRPAISHERPKQRAYKI
jgi:hypothetical protein